MSFQLQDLMADHYGPRTAQSYDQVIGELAWDYQVALKAAVAEALYGRRHLLHTENPSILELGTGTGNLARELFSWIVQGRLRGESYSTPMEFLGVDSSDHMMAVAEKKVAPFDFVKSQFLCGPMENILETLNPAKPFQLILSSFAIHHLSLEEKGQLFQNLYPLLAEGGLFIMADRMPPAAGSQQERDYLQVISTPLWKLFPEPQKAPQIEPLSQAMAQSFTDDGDQPSTPGEHEALLREAGFQAIRMPFYSFGFGVISAWKPTSSS